MNISCVQPWSFKENFHQKFEGKTKCSKIKKPKVPKKSQRKRLLRKQVRLLRKGNVIFLQITLFLSLLGFGYETSTTFTKLDPSQPLEKGKKPGAAVLTNLVALKSPLFKDTHYFDQKSLEIILNKLL